MSQRAVSTDVPLAELSGPCLACFGLIDLAEGSLYTLGGANSWNPMIYPGEPRSGQGSPRVSQDSDRGHPFAPALVERQLRWLPTRSARHQG
jgi:hypothetical protein